MNYLTPPGRFSWTAPSWLGLALALAFTSAGIPVLAADIPDLASTIERFAQPLSAVTSDSEALALFSSQLASPLDLTGPLTPEQHETATQLVAELAAWRVAAAIRKAADADDRAALPPLLQSAVAQRNWLLRDDRLPALRRVLSFSDAQSLEEPGRLPRLAGLALRAEAEGERNARLLWDRLHSWGEQLKARKALARLCGTWQWTVHNHKNHREFKTAVAFPPPDSPEAVPGPRPSKIVVLGDAVYLRWDFQGGYQEDSLLFGKEDRLLEGTFRNTAGDWGAITGKRTGPCAR